MADLAGLRKKTQNYTVLYVEDSSILLKKMGIFLGKLFKEVYQSTNGIEGLKSYKENQPDIVITDLDMPGMNGHKMVQEIKKENPNAHIIIYSAYANSENLLESIHLGVADFIPKPVDIELFEKVLFKVIGQIEQNGTYKVPKTTQEKKQIDKTEHDEIFKHMEIINKSGKSIEFVNHYKGVPIFDKGTIYVMDHNTITVEVPFLQAKVIKHEGKTVLISELFEHTIEAQLDKFNAHNNTVVLKNLQYLQDKTKRRKVVCVEPNNNFECVVSFQTKSIESSVILLSSEFIILNLALSDEIELIEGDTLDVELSIQKQIDKTHEITTKIELKGELYFMNVIDKKNMKVMVLLEIDHTQKEHLEEYIILRRQELITEFKQKKA